MLVTVWGCGHLFLLLGLLGGGGGTLAGLLLGQQDGVDVGQNTALRDRNVVQELVQFLVVTDGELNVARDDTGLLVVTGGVAGQLEDFGGEVLEDSGEVDGRTATDTGGVTAITQETVDTADGELQAGTSRTRLRLAALGLATATLALARHDEGCEDSHKR